MFTTKDKQIPSGLERKRKEIERKSSAPRLVDKSAPSPASLHEAWQRRSGSIRLEVGKNSGARLSPGSNSSMGALASLQTPLSHGLRLGADGGYLESLRARRLQRAAPPSPGIAGIEAIPVRRRDVRATLQFGARLERPLPLDRTGWRVCRRSGWSA